ncbi:MAG: CRISPR-associated helicase Cas3', partial [Candidatus Aminicenantes bacterium]|nr:CRISPR-associated helicase Cas3' [Candidatus Aminicenantes bacterium]
HDRSEIYNLLSEGNIPPATAEELAALKDELRDLLHEYNSLLATNIKTINRRFTKFLLAPQNVILMDSLAGEKKFDFAYRKRYIFFKGLLHRADHYASSLEKEDDNVENIEIEPPPIAAIETALQTEIEESCSETTGLNLKETWQYKKLHEKNLRGKNTVLIGATGIGKTEFAFLWGAGKKLFFTLPMRTMTNEIFKRAAKVFDKKNVGLMHSSAAAVLPGILHNVKEGETADVEWHISLSRNLSFPVIVSTGDQVLNASLKYPTYEKIMSTLGYSNLVIDEIQAYSPETSAIIVKTIEEVVHIGGNFLLMTATLPEYIKKEIIDRTKIPEQDIFTVLSKQGDKDIIKNKIFLEKIEDNKKEEKPDKPGKTEQDKDLDAFYHKVREIILRNKDKKILVTINTVGNAQQIYKRIKDDAPFLSGLFIKHGNVMLIHSRFIGKDREAKIEKLTNKELKAQEPEIKILVSTQVIEASVNIDFDILITETAPLDSLIQRMGRVNRNRGEYSEEKGQG